MPDLVVIGFDTADEADRVLGELHRLQKEYLVDLADAVVAIHGQDGKVRLKQSVSTIGIGATSGGASGMFWGTLVGLLFLNPLAGLALGGIVGAGTGALAGALVDYGIDDDFIRKLGEALPLGGSALFVLVRKAQPEKLLEELSGFKGRVLRTSLSPDQERRLHEALARGG